MKIRSILYGSLLGASRSTTWEKKIIYPWPERKYKKELAIKDKGMQIFGCRLVWKTPVCLNICWRCILLNDRTVRLFCIPSSYCSTSVSSGWIWYLNLTEPHRQSEHNMFTFNMKINEKRMLCRMLVSLQISSICSLFFSLDFFAPEI